MTTPTTCIESVTDSDDFHDWLEITLEKSSSPGPTIARRHVDILEPESPHSQVDVSDAA